MAKNRKRKKAAVELSGALTIRQATETYERLCAAVDGGDGVILDLSGVSACDLSLVQMIEAARVSCARADRSLTLAAPADGVVREVLARGGFLDPANPTRVEFWTHTGAAQ